MKTLFLAVLLSGLPAMAADIYQFSLVPGDGGITGAPGSTIGWGYSIHNESSSLWLVTTGLDEGVFQHGTPTLLFGFPAIAPGSTGMLPFEAASASGLAELTWDSSAPAGFENSGSFALRADWWNGDPLGDGRFQFAAPASQQPYAATVATPEPSTVALVALPLLVSGLLRCRRKLRS